MKIINDKKLQEKLGFNPHPAQQEILDKLNRFTTIVAGRRFGKSELCAYLAIRELLAKDRKIWIVAPTYDLSEKISNYIIRWILQSFPHTFKIQQAPTLTIQSPTGSVLEGKSADNAASLMGEELDLLILDEAPSMVKQIWQTYLFPTLAMRRGRALFIGSPKGQNWFYDIYQKGKAKDENYVSFHFESRDNPHLPIEEWEAAKRDLPQDVFDQEYKAIFLSDAAAVFRNINDCIYGEFEEPQKNHIYVAGIDLGKHQDFTVIAIIDMNTFKVVHIDRFNIISWPLQKQRIISTVKKYNDAIINIDSTGVGDPISDDLVAEGLNVNDYRYTNKSKDQLISKLSIYIQQKRIKYPAYEPLLDELRVFGYKITKGGRFVYSAPEGHHDDIVNALGLAVWELSEEPLGEGSPEVFNFPQTTY